MSTTMRSLTLMGLASLLFFAGGLLTTIDSPFGPPSSTLGSAVMLLNVAINVRLETRRPGR